MGGERQAQLLTHLRGCAICDRSFRVFALTAPVLHSATEPDWSSWAARPIGLDANGFGLSSTPSSAEHQPYARTLNRLLPAFVMAAAATIALYFAAPPHMTFEDAIAADNSNVEVASYSSADSLFGQELMTQDTPAPDLSDE
ncbi:MAG: hypothetical protein JO071_12310 [Deltaproteobacteria bacterium]|nr:hypothetical protein [Deltaproteobacteria bacterium]